MASQDKTSPSGVNEIVPETEDSNELSQYSNVIPPSQLVKVASAYDPSKTAAKARTFLEVGAACRIIGNHVTDKDQYIGIEGKIKAVETKSFKRNYGYQVVLDGCKATPKIFAPEAVEAWDAGNLSQLTSGSQTQTQSQRGSSLSQLLLTSPAPVSSPPEKSSPNNPSQASSTTALISSKKTPQSRPNNETCTCEAHKNPTTLSEPFVQSQERCDFCVAKAAGKQRGGKKRKGDHLEKENAMDANVAATLELLRDELALKDSEIAKLKKKNEGMTQQVTNFRVEMKKYKERLMRYEKLVAQARKSFESGHRKGLAFLDEMPNL